MVPLSREQVSYWDKFDHLVGSLPKASVRMVMYSLELPDMDHPYSVLIK